MSSLFSSSQPYSHQVFVFLLLLCLPSTCANPYPLPRILSVVHSDKVRLLHDAVRLALSDYPLGIHTSTVRPAFLQGLQDVCWTTNDTSPTVGIVGPVTSGGLWLRELAVRWKLPVVSGSATSTASVGEGFWRTVPSDSYTAEATVQTIRKMKVERESHMGERDWLVYEKERVGVLYEDSRYGSAGVAALMAASVRTSQENITVGKEDVGEVRDGDIRFLKNVGWKAGDDPEPKLQEFKDANITIIIVWATNLGKDGIVPLMMAAEKLDMLNSKYQWYLSHAVDSHFNFANGTRALDLAKKAVGILTIRPAILPNEKGLDVEKRLLALPEHDEISIKNWHPYTLYIYDAALALAKAAASVGEGDNGSRWTSEEHRSFSYGKCPWERSGSPSAELALGEALSKLSFEGASGRVKFEENRERYRKDVACEVLNLQPASDDIGAEFKTLYLYSFATGDFSRPKETEQFLGSPSRAESQVYPGGSNAYPSDRPSFIREKVKVLTRIEYPFVIAGNESEGSRTYDGFSIDIVKRISDAMNFKYEIHTLEGKESPDELKRLVADGKYDFAIAFLTVNSVRSRAENIKFSPVYYNLSLRFMILRDSERISDYSILRPFEPQLWIAIGCILVLHALLSVIFTTFPSNEAGVEPPSKDIQFLKHFGLPLFHSILTLLQNNQERPKGFYQRLITLMLVLFSLIVIATYAAELFSFLAKTQREKVIESIRDIDGKRIKWKDVAVATGGSVQSYVERKFIGCDPNCPRPPVEYLGVATAAQGVEMLKRRKALVFINDGPLLEAAASEDCSVKVVGEPFYEQGYAIIFRRDSDPQVEQQFRRVVLELRENGTITELEKKWIKKNNFCERRGEDDEGRSLTVTRMSSAIYPVLGITIFTLIIHIWRRASIALRTKHLCLPISNLIPSRLPSFRNWRKAAEVRLDNSETAYP